MPASYNYRNVILNDLFHESCLAHDNTKSIVVIFISPIHLCPFFSYNLRLYLGLSFVNSVSLA